MSENVLVALIALAGTLSGSYLGVRQANRLTVYRIEQLEKKVMKHNNLIERMTRAETRLDDLEKRKAG